MASQLSDTQMSDLDQIIGTQASDTIPTLGSQAVRVKGILESGIDQDRGIVRFLIDWDGTDEDGDPLEPGWESFYAINDPTILYSHYMGWPTWPQRGTPEEDALDAAAGNPHWELFKQGFLAVLEAVAKDAIAHVSLRDVYTMVGTFVRMAYQMMISIPVPVLQGILGGGLLRRKARSEDMYAWLTNNLRKSEDRPSVYLIEFADEIGRSLTYRDMLAILKGARQYMNMHLAADVEFAIKVESNEGELDLFEEQAIRSGVRKWVTSDKAKERLDELVTNLESRIQNDLAQDPNKSRRMPFVLRDIGYTIRGIKRLDAHLDHTGSANKIMALFALVAKAKGLEKHALHADVIFLAFRDEHAIAAEVLFSLLARSYTTTGTGFNSIQAGLSNV